MQTSSDSPAFQRLNALLSVGYEIEEFADKGPRSDIWLDHPAGRRFPHSRLIAYADGLVVGTAPANSSKSQLRLASHDADAFAQFLGSVPEPSFLSRPIKMRTWVYVIIVVSFMYLLFR